MKKLSFAEIEVQTSSGIISAFFYEGSPLCPFLAFIHGNSSMKEIFKEQYNYLVQKDISFFSLDLPGHGKSYRDVQAEKSDFVYSIPYHAKTVAEVLPKISKKKPLLVGHSLGGHIATQVSTLIECKGLLTFQAPPLEKAEDISRAFGPVEGLDAMFMDVINEDNLQKVMRAFFRGTEPLLEVITAFRNTEPLCRKNLAASVAPGCSLKEVSILRQLKVPLCMPLATEDTFMVLSYMDSLDLPGTCPMFWQKRFIPIPDAGHYPQLDQPNLFNEILDQFSRFCFSP